MKDATVDEAEGPKKSGKKGLMIAAVLALLGAAGAVASTGQLDLALVIAMATAGCLLGDLLWFALLISVNLQTSFLTPPFGFSLFYLKAVAPKDVRIQQIYRGVLPFIIIQLIVISVLAVNPEIARWLPDKVDQAIGIKP